MAGGSSFQAERDTTVTHPDTHPDRAHVERYDAGAIEPRWQARWDEIGLYRTDLHDASKPKYYLLTMYDYPSGNLHIGHWYVKTPTDAIARYHRMLGQNVFFPVGFDAYGLPAENAAIKNGVNPRDWTMSNIEIMRRQLRTMGASFDWDAEVVTCDPAYYRWNQWLFLEFMKAGLVYRAKAPVDWCPNDGTLAREQVEGTDRRCWRCGAKVEKRDLEQWRMRITKYADELLDFSEIAWPEPIRAMQTNWIGRSEGGEIVFTTAPSAHHAGGEELRVFTTRPDTLFGATFMVLAPEHPLVESLTAPERRAEVDAYVEKARNATEIERLSTDREKTGVAIGADAVNPINGERIPIYIADYVLSGYGTGAIMAVPAHDERDFAFATQFGLPIRRVVAAPGTEDAPLDAAFISHADDERLVNSGPYTGLTADEGGRAIIAALAERGAGEPAITYRIRDWLDQPPALLGHAHPDHPLRAVRRRAGTRRDQLPVLLPANGGLPGQRGEPARKGRGVPQRRMPVLRRPGEARDGHPRHVHRFLVVLVSVPVAGAGQRAGGRRDDGSLDAGRPVHGWRRTRRDASPLQPLLHQGDAGYRPDPRERAVQAAVQPGPDPGRRRRADEQVAGQRPGPGQAGFPLRRRHGSPVPDVHGPVGPGRPVERERDRRRAPVPEPRLGDRHGSPWHRSGRPGRRERCRPARTRPRPRPRSARPLIGPSAT